MNDRKSRSRVAEGPNPVGCNRRRVNRTTMTRLFKSNSRSRLYVGITALVLMGTAAFAGFAFGSVDEQRQLGDYCIVTPRRFERLLGGDSKRSLARQYLAEFGVLQFSTNAVRAEQRSLMVDAPLSLQFNADDFGLKTDEFFDLAVPSASALALQGDVAGESVGADNVVVLIRILQNSVREDGTPGFLYARRVFPRSFE